MAFFYQLVTLHIMDITTVQAQPFSQVVRAEDQRDSQPCRQVNRVGHRSPETGRDQVLFQLVPGILNGRYKLSILSNRPNLDLDRFLRDAVELFPPPLRLPPSWLFFSSDQFHLLQKTMAPI